jgi:hypothetical protein
MKLSRVAIPILAMVIATSWSGPIAAQETCRFVLGFATLRNLVGAEKVGGCLEDEHFNLENGNAEQRTTGGLLAWRKIDNFTAFTDGGTTWVNGPNGLQSRPNGERFSWERDPVQTTTAPPSTSVTAPPSARSSAPPSTSSPKPAPAASAAPERLPANDPAPVELKGTGRQTTDVVSLRAGLIVARSSHQGRSNFIVKLVDSKGKESDLLANAVGDSSSVRVGRVEEAGRYSLNVTADGRWTVRMEQPSPVDVTSLPKTFTGKGDGVAGWVQLPQGRVVANSRMRSGNSNFMVHVIEQDGRRADLLANDIGVSSGSKAFEGKGRVVLLSVQGDGEWSVALES